jgi:hypothetical protein
VFLKKTVFNAYIYKDLNLKNEGERKRNKCKGLPHETLIICRKKIKGERA